MLQRAVSPLLFSLFFPHWYFHGCRDAFPSLLPFQSGSLPPPFLLLGSFGVPRFPFFFPHVGRLSFIHRPPPPCFHDFPPFPRSFLLFHALPPSLFTHLVFSWPRRLMHLFLRLSLTVPRAGTLIFFELPKRIPKNSFCGLSLEAGCFYSFPPLSWEPPFLVTLFFFPPFV